VKLARTLTGTFAGIAPSSAPAFVAAQLVGAAAGLVVARVLYPEVASAAGEVVVPHERG
jgi:glycerol uptake facilitator-like aquaporin